MKSISSIMVAFLLVSASAASADYILTPLSGGANELTLPQGQQFTLDLRPEHNGVGIPSHGQGFFSVYFDKPGLDFLQYDWPWAPDFDNSLIDGVAIPQPPVPPLGPITAEVNFQGIVIMSPEFDASVPGPYIKMLIGIPAGFPDGDVIITVGNFDFQDGSNRPIPTQAGNRFILHVPEPATLSLLALGGFALVRRKRRG